MKKRTKWSKDFYREYRGECDSSVGKRYFYNNYEFRYRMNDKRIARSFARSYKHLRILRKSRKRGVVI